MDQTHPLPNRLALTTTASLVLLLLACRQERSQTTTATAATATVPPAAAQPAPYAPVERWEPMKIPADNPMSTARADLGRHVFFDKRLSGDGKFSCYSCHLNERGLTDGKPLNVAPFDKKLTRHTPTLWNIGYHPEWYWDGRAKTLEGQALAAWKGVNMGADPEKVVAVLNAIPQYSERFQEVFGGPATPDNVSKALATYMRTIVSKDTPFDRWQRGDQGAVSDDAKRGYEVFQRAKCDNCHGGIFFTDFQYHNVGIGMDKPEPDPGRFKVTNNPRDTGAFKTPTLRDIGDSGPYFHDGSVATLEEAVKFMVAGGRDNPHLDRTNLQKAALTDEELRQLVAFLRSLDEAARLEAPQLP